MTLTKLITAEIKDWHGVKLSQPDWGYHSHCIVLRAESLSRAVSVYAIFNAYWEHWNSSSRVPMMGQNCHGGDG